MEAYLQFTFLFLATYYSTLCHIFEIMNSIIFLLFTATSVVSAPATKDPQSPDTSTSRPKDPKLLDTSNEPSSSTSKPDCAAVLDIADAVQKRIECVLTFEEKQRFMSSTLKVGPMYELPYIQGKNQKFHLKHSHLEGRNSCFYYSPKLEGVFCL